MPMILPKQLPQHRQDRSVCPGIHSFPPTLLGRRTFKASQDEHDKWKYREDLAPLQNVLNLLVLTESGMADMFLTPNTVFHFKVNVNYFV